MNSFHRFQNFRQFSNLFSQIWMKKRHTSFFSGICREIRKKIHQKFAEKCKFGAEHEKIGNSLFIEFHSRKMLTISGWNFEIWAVQTVCKFSFILFRLFCIIHFHYFIFNFGSFLQKTHKCKSCRSRQELSNEYLLAKIGVGTAENEPLKVWEKIQFIIHLPP